MTQFELWVSNTARYCEPTSWRDCEAAYLAGQASIEQRVKDLEQALDDMGKAYGLLNAELEGQKKANGFLVAERDRACEQHHEVARKLFEVERGRDALRERLCAHEAAVQMINAEWRDYLKEDETPIDRLKREIADNHAILGLLAEEKRKAEALKARAGEPVTTLTFDELIDAVDATTVTEADVIAMLARLDDFRKKFYTAPSTPAAEPEHEKLHMALENCRLLAARHRKEDWALLILGFCAEGGVVGSVMR